MDDLIDLMIDNESPSDISDRVKELLYAKSAEKVEGERPNISAGLFGDEADDVEPQEEEETDGN
tara:strand:+ start:108 stop:299 length:192 start_codon:yes stop_codon:yes gene_type:complete